MNQTCYSNGTSTALVVRTMLEILEVNKNATPRYDGEDMAVRLFSREREKYEAFARAR